MEYEENAKIVKVDTDDEYEFARDMQVIPFVCLLTYFPFFCSSVVCCTELLN